MENIKSAKKPQRCMDEQYCMKTIKSIIALTLVSIAVFGLCSCRSKTAEPAEKADNTTAYITSAQKPAEPETTQTEQTTSQAEQTTLQAEQTIPQEETTAANPEQTEAQPLQTAARQMPLSTSAASQSQTKKAAAAADVKNTGAEKIKDGNKTVFYPSELKMTNKKYPVISWANGTGCPTLTYYTLLEKLAEGGYIVVADSSVMTADGKSQIDSIDYIIGKNSDPSSIFFGRADTAKIGVCGHSQGGRSCINAAQADPRIRCVVSIAGSSSVKEADGLGVPCLFFAGTNDLIVVASVWCKPSYNAVAGRAVYASLKGGIHISCMIKPKLYSGYTLDWFDAYLKNDSDARKVFESGGELALDKAWKDFQNKN